MDSVTARRVVVGALAVTGTVSAVRAVADNDPNTKASGNILVGSLAAAAGLSLVAGPAPDVAAGLAVIIAITAVMPRGDAWRQLTQTIRDNQAVKESTKLAEKFPGVGTAGAFLSRDWSQALATQTARHRLQFTGNPTADIQGTGALAAGTDGQIVTIRGVRGARGFLTNLWAAIDAAAADGVRLTIGNVYRSEAEQAALRITNGCPDVNTSPASACRIPTARPGESMHNKGQAVDFANLSDAGYRWLTQHGASYSLYNLPTERWHWSVNGK